MYCMEYHISAQVPESSNMSIGHFCTSMNEIVKITKLDVFGLLYGFGEDGVDVYGIQMRYAQSVGQCNFG